MAGELDFIRTNPHPNSVIYSKTHINIECSLIIVESMISKLFGYCACISYTMNYYCYCCWLLFCLL